MMHVSIFKSHADINTSHVDINILHVYILMLHPAFGLLSETSSRSEFSIYKTFRACWHNLSCKWGAETCPQNFCQSWFILSPPPLRILFYKCCHCIIYMDLNLRLYLFSDRELNYFIIFDIYNMHLSFFFRSLLFQRCNACMAREYQGTTIF